MQSRNANNATDTHGAASLLKKIGIAAIAACAMLALACKSDSTGEGGSTTKLYSSKVIPLPDLYRDFFDSMAKKTSSEGEIGAKSKYYKKRIKTSGILLEVDAMPGKEYIDGEMKTVYYPVATLHVPLPDKTSTEAQLRFSDPAVLEKLKSKINTEIQITGVANFGARAYGNVPYCLIFDSAELL